MKLKRLTTGLVLFVLSMITIPSFGQSSDSLQARSTAQLYLDFQNDYIQDEYKVVDSWVYINDFGEIRYDLPKFRVQKLERYGRQFTTLNSLYLNSQVMVDQIADANLNLQQELMAMQPKLNELRNKNNELINIHNRLIGMYNRTKTENDQLEIQLTESKKKAKKYRSQRNWAVAGVAILVGSAIFSLR